MSSLLPRVQNDLRLFSVAAFGSLNPMEAADLTAFLFEDEQLPEGIRNNYQRLKWYCEDPTSFARESVASKLKIAGSAVTDAQISQFIKNYTPPELPRVVKKQSSITFTNVTASGGTSVNGGNNQFLLAGGRNAVLLDVRATAYLTAGTGSANLDFIDYQDQDTNNFTWVDTTPLTNFAGTAREPGLIFPQKWFGQLNHNITITNNWSAAVTVKLSFDAAVVYLVGA
jgi:hypothetical protein